MIEYLDNLCRKTYFQFVFQPKSGSKLVFLKRKLYFCTIILKPLSTTHIIIMIHIGDTLVSEDVLSTPFCCDLTTCRGNCCNSEGDSGAPLDEDELQALDEVLPLVWDDLTPRGREVIEQQGAYFKDKAGDWVTSVVDGRDCVYCTYADGGLCLCAIEKAFREGKFQTLSGYRNGKAPFMKPISCHLYPIRLKRIGDYTAVNYDEQPKMCGCAIKLGRKQEIRIYQCLHDALVRKFGQTWYKELETCAEEMKKLGMF